MKRNQFIKVIVASVLLIVCAISVQAEKVTGSGNVVKETRSAEAFTSFKCYGIADIYLSQGEKEEVIVETDDNLQDYIITEFSKGTLSIKNKEGVNFKNNPKIKIYITVKDLNRMDFYGVGDLECLTELNLDILQISNNGVGNLILKGKVNELSIQNNGVGNIMAFDFRAQKASIHNSGVGNVKINAALELEINNSGVGNAEYKGGAKIVDINSSGIGRIKKR